MSAVHEAAPPAHDPFVDLVPPQGVKLTPRHYAYLKISEGCSNRCSFCIIPALRGDLVSRPIDQVLREAEKLVNAGVKELLVISQDTSAYGLDLKYQEAMWQDRAVRTKFLDLSRELGQMGIWVRMHYVYPYPHVDEVIPLMAEGKILPYLDIPFQHASPAVLKNMRRPAHQEKRRAAFRHGAKPAPISPFAPPSSSAIRVKRKKISRCCSTGSMKPGLSAPVASSMNRSRERKPMISAWNRFRKKSRKPAGIVLWPSSSRFPPIFSRKGRQASASHHR